MKLTIRTTNRFEKSVKKCVKRGLNLQLLRDAVHLLAQEGSLPPKYKAHKLSGRYASVWECHIAPDWLLLWEQDDTELVLLLLDTGTHSDIF